MKGLIGCEKTQAVTIEFTNRGHLFNSCDIQECSGPMPDLHFKDSIFHVISQGAFLAGLDFAGMHPPCTYLTNSSIGWLVRKSPKEGFEWDDKLQRYVNWNRWKEMEKAVTFFKSCLSIVQTVGRGYVENPIMHCYAMQLIGIEPSQIIQPYQFGHPERKATCLWLVGLPKLKETNNVKLEMEQLPKNQSQRLHYASPSPERANIRSATFSGIARAMAEQWG